MILRIVLFRLKPEMTEDHYLPLLSAFKTAVAGVPGLLGFHVGQRVGGTEKLYPLVDAGTYDFAVVYQFATETALRLYERRAAYEELRKRFAQVIDSVVVGDYEA